VRFVAGPFEQSMKALFNSLLRADIREESTATMTPTWPECSLDNRKTRLRAVNAEIHSISELAQSIWRTNCLVENWHP
jgi:hypothetical protein